MNFSTELVIRIWNDKSGERYEIRPDNDSLGLVEVCYVDENGKTVNSIIFPPEIAQNVADAILLCAKENKGK